MFLTEDERVVLSRVLARLLAPPGPRPLTIQEQREVRRKAAEDGQKKTTGG
jgi:hypothetical protein